MIRICPSWSVLLFFILNLCIDLLFSKNCTLSMSSFNLPLLIFWTFFQFAKITLKSRLVLEISCSHSRFFDVSNFYSSLILSSQSIKKLLEVVGPEAEPFSRAHLGLPIWQQTIDNYFFSTIFQELGHISRACLEDCHPRQCQKALLKSGDIVTAAVPCLPGQLPCQGN